MKNRILVTDSDVYVLNFAFRVLREQGYNVIAECDPSHALHVAQRWMPEMIIAPVSCLKEWAALSGGTLDEVMPDSVFVVTIDPSEDSPHKYKFPDNRCEILLKPLVHPTQILVAIEAAMKLSSQYIPVNEDSPDESIPAAEEPEITTTS